MRARCIRSPQSKLPGRIVADASNISNPIAAAEQDTQQLIQLAQSRNLDAVVEISNRRNKFHAQFSQKLKKLIIFLLQISVLLRYIFR